MRRLSKLLLFVVSVALILVIVFVVNYIKQQPLSADTAYVGSAKCNSCHMGEHHDWQKSLHAKMMRKVDVEGVVVADFHAEGITFDPQQAVWAIGSKWEQQFMGVEDGHEVLLPGAWLKSTSKWKTQGWDGWTVPDPLKRCHGCHTVGLNIETGKFVEPSVGCESCHGPGDWHASTMGVGKIATGLDAQICGQCHTRGHSKKDGLFYPHGYRPGDNLADYFDEIKPYSAQNTSQWWSNGHARKRHQEYFSWKQGGHSDSLKHLKNNYNGRYGDVTSKCLSCHAGEAAVDKMSEDYLLENVEQGVTCAVCHNTHNQLDQPRITCNSCHTGGAYYHQSEKNETHIACSKEAQVGCVGCHMPKTVMNGGAYTLHSHKAGVITPKESQKIGVPNSCANGGCHNDKSLDWLDIEYKKHYGNLNSKREL